MKTDIEKCVKNSDCRIYTSLDKKIEKSLTFCIVVNGLDTCYVSTCTCPKNARKRRALSSAVHDTGTKDKANSKMDPECTIMQSENLHSISNHNFGTKSRTNIENQTKCINASMLTTGEENIFIGNVSLRGLCISFSYVILKFHTIL